MSGRWEGFIDACVSVYVCVCLCCVRDYIVMCTVCILVQRSSRNESAQYVSVAGSCLPRNRSDSCQECKEYVSSC